MGLQAEERSTGGNHLLQSTLAKKCLGGVDRNANRREELEEQPQVLNMLLKRLRGHNDIVYICLGPGVFAKEDVYLALHIGRTVLKSHNTDIKVFLPSV